MVLHDCMTAASLDSPPRVPGRTPPYRRPPTRRPAAAASSMARWRGSEAPISRLEIYACMHPCNKSPSRRSYYYYYNLYNT